MVVVDLVLDTGDQLDDCFSVVVTWSGLSSDANDSWNELGSSLMLWGIKDGQVSVDDVEDVHELSLVLMDSLDLDIVHAVDWNIDSGVLLDPSGKLGFVRSLDLDESVLEVFVTSIWHELLQVLEGSDPLIDSTEGIADEIGELWVAAMDPSSWSDTIGLVLELSFVELIELRENGFLQKLGVKGCDLSLIHI